MLRLRVITGADGILKMSGMLGEELEVSKSEPISPCTTRSKKGFEIEFRAHPPLRPLFRALPRS
jgi:hypothetical protein